MKEQQRIAILIIGNSISGGGGAERRFIRIWNFMLDKNKDLYQIHLIINKSLYKSALKANLISVSDDYDSRLHVIPDGNCIKVSYYVVKKIKEYKLSLLHLVLAQKKLIPLYFYLYFNKKILVTHSVTLSWFSYKVKIPIKTLILSRIVWKISSKIDSLYSGFVEIYAKPLNFAHKVDISPCSFSDIDRFYPRLKKKYVVFCGRLIEEKNPLLFVEALELISQEINDWKVIIAGSGKLENLLTRTIKEKKLDNLIEIVQNPDMSETLGKSMIFVSLQETENYPSQSLLEAMLSKNAVIATNVGETSRIVIDNFNGLLINKNYIELSEKILFLTKNTDFRNKISENSREFIINNHSIERFSTYIIEFWKKALAGK